MRPRIIIAIIVVVVVVVIVVVVVVVVVVLIIIIIIIIIVIINARRLQVLQSTNINGREETVSRTVQVGACKILYIYIHNKGETQRR